MQKFEASKPEARIIVNQPALVIDDEGNETSCIVVDVSKSGFRLKLEKAALTGSGHQLVLNDTKVKPIVIRWASAGEVGGEFLD